MNHDRRTLPRLQVQKNGTVLFIDQPCFVECMIRNVSEDGALLSLIVSVPLPRKILLWDQRADKLYACEVKWRKDDTVGVHFVDVRHRAKTPMACSQHFGWCSGQHVALDALAGVASAAIIAEAARRRTALRKINILQNFRTQAPVPARPGNCASRTTASAGCCCSPGWARYAAGSRTGVVIWKLLIKIEQVLGGRVAVMAAADHQNRRDGTPSTSLLILPESVRSRD